LPAAKDFRKGFLWSQTDSAGQPQGRVRNAASGDLQCVVVLSTAQQASGRSRLRLLDYVGRNPAVIEKSAELDERFDGRAGTGTMLIEHHPLRGPIAAAQRSDQETVMLAEFLQGSSGCAMEFYESLLTAATQQGSIHGQTLVVPQRSADASS
jgi:hypothetical protein